MICDSEISLYCEAPCGAIRDSKVRNIGSERAWIVSWRISIHVVCKPQNIKSDCCKTMMNKLKTSHITDIFDGDISDESTYLRSSKNCRSLKKAQRALKYFNVAVKIQILLKTQQARSHILSNDSPKSSYWAFSRYTAKIQAQMGMLPSLQDRLKWDSSEKIHFATQHASDGDVPPKI